MKINHNVNAMITQHALFQNNTAMGKSLEKLSTGLRINRAQDDAAGLAMSEQMRTQIRGLGKAKQNSQDGIAALQIAEGGLAEITNIMQRQRELAVQSANDTLTSTERRYLDLEFQELTKEIARIAKTTDYNGKNMLNWSADPNLSFGAIGDKYQLEAEIDYEINHLRGWLDKITVPEARDKFADLFLALDALDNFNPRDYEPVDPGPPPVYNPPTNTPVQGAQDLQDIIDEIQTQLNALTPAIIAEIKSNPDDDPSTEQGLSYGEREIIDSILRRVDKIINNNAPPKEDSLVNLYKEMVLNDMTSAASYTLHIGPNYSSGMGTKWANEMTVTYISLNPGSLGLSTKDITTQNNSTEVIDCLDKVIKSVSGVRAKIGTYVNRLDYTINNIASLEFNTQDAESRIRDTDFAQATTDFTRNQILVQSATSMLAQANTLPQTALTLING